MMMRAGLVLAAGLVLVTGCGASGLQTGAGTVEKKTTEAFLTTVESDWHQRVDTEPNKNLSPDGRCYFVTGADGNQSLGTVACGPLRRLGTAERQVWDLVRITTTGGDEPGLEIPENEPWKQSQLRPDSSSLWRPDDKVTDDNADNLAAPPAPAATSGLITVTAKSETLELKPTSDKLVLPDGTVTLKGLATPETIGSGTEVKAPASGEKFIAAIFSTSPTIDPLTDRPGFDGTTTATKWTVSVGGEQRPVDVLPRGDASAMTGDQMLLVSVPKDAPDVLLTATSGPVVQSLSLTTGKRTTDAAATYYRTGTLTDLNKSLPKTAGNQGRDFTSTYSLALQKAVLTPWDPARGWAPQGKAWVRVQLASTLNYESIQYQIEWTAPFLTATADGRPVPAVPNKADDDYIALEVPADTKVVQLTATARLKFAAKSYALSATPKSGTVTYPSLTATATFR
ncbi:hypothetical protein ACFPJ1_24120 [Kribbella qitaiheensis]|uniref:hypothetical protein n=1 Tax=Kribbella qitaiheensis TaxID=1544730 RepID=UPI00362351E4